MLLPQNAPTNGYLGLTHPTKEQILELNLNKIFKPVASLSSIEFLEIEQNEAAIQSFYPLLITLLDYYIFNKQEFHKQ